MIIDKQALRNIAELLLKPEPDRDAIAVEWDRAIRMKQISWLPRWLAAGFEQNDRRFNLALADATLFLREELESMGALVLRS